MILSDTDYRRLLAFRTQLRRFDRRSEQRARDFGLTHAQHQLLLAIRGHDDARGPTIGEVAEHLLVRHHTAVELVDRAQLLGFITRRRDRRDGRVVRLALTAKGRRRVDALSGAHVEELRELTPILTALVEDASSALYVPSQRAPSGQAHSGVEHRIDEIHHDVRDDDEGRR